MMRRLLLSLVWCLVLPCLFLQVACERKPKVTEEPEDISLDDKTVAAKVDPKMLELMKKQKEQRDNPTVNDGPKGPPPKIDVRISVFGPKKGLNEWLGSAYTQGADAAFDAFKKSDKASRFSPELGEGDPSKRGDQLSRLFLERPRPVAIVGHIDDDEAIRRRAEYHNRPVLMLPLPVGTEELIRDSQVYFIGTDEVYYSRCILALAKKAGFGDVAVIADGSPHAHRMKDHLAEAGQQLKVKIHSLNTVDRPETLGDQMSKVLDGAPKALVLVTRHPHVARDMVKALAKAKNSLPVLLSDGGASMDFVRSAGELPFPCHVVSCFDPTAKQAQTFVTDYTKRFNVPPDQWAALTYDAIQMFFATLSVEREEVSAQTFEAGLRTLFSASKPFRGVTGDLWFDPTGCVVARPVSLLTFKGLGPGALARHAVQLTAKERQDLANTGDEPTGVPSGTGGDTSSGGDNSGGGGDNMGDAGGDDMGDAGGDDMGDAGGDDMGDAGGDDAGDAGGDDGGMGAGGDAGGDGGDDLGGAGGDDGGTEVAKEVIAGVTWYGDLEDALDEADESGKPIMVDFFSVTCGPCMKMKKTTWISESFKKAAKNWVMVRIDLDKPRYAPLVASYKIKDLPGIAFMTSTGCMASLVQSAFKSGPDMADLMKTEMRKVKALAAKEKALLKTAEDPDNAENAAPQKAVADLYYTKNNWLEALSYYQSAFHMYVSAGQKGSAIKLYPRMIRAQVKALDFEGALGTSKEWIDKYPGSKGVDYAYYMKGYNELRLKKYADAKATFGQLKSKFGQGHKRYVLAKKIYPRYAGKPLE